MKYAFLMRREESAVQPVIGPVLEVRDTTESYWGRRSENGYEDLQVFDIGPRARHGHLDGCGNLVPSGKSGNGGFRLLGDTGRGKGRNQAKQE